MSEICPISFGLSASAGAVESQRSAYSVGATDRHFVDVAMRLRDGALDDAAFHSSSWRRVRLAALREEIAAGTFETPERIAGTVRRLLDVVL
jgi:hypothetical protein